MPLTKAAPGRTTGSVTATDREHLIQIITAEVSTLKAIGEPIRPEAIRHFARRLGVPAPELSARIGAWPVCADD